VIRSVHQHEVYMLHYTQPEGTRIATCSAKVREGEVLLPGLPKNSSFCIHELECVCVCVCVCTSLPLLSRVLWYVFMAHRHKTSLQSSGEGHKLPISTGEGPLFTCTSLCTHDLAWTHPLVRRCEQIHLLHFFP